jgi:hypothetical protein
MHEAVRRGEQRNPLICRFFHDLETCYPASAVQLLSSPALHCLNRRGKFTRELTEALAMLAQLRRIIARAEAHSDETDETDETDEPDEPGDTGSRPGSGSWHVIDLCCGKAFFGTLVAALFPSCCVHCVDRQPPTFLPHFVLAGLAERIAYVQLDVLSIGFVNEVRALIEANGGRRVIVMGMHLCGILALRAIDLIRQLPRVEALVLAPCCLPNAAHAEDTPPSVFEPREPHAQYTRWCDFLERRIQGRSELVVGADWRPEACLECSLECSGCSLECSGCSLWCTRESEAALISEKNTLLTAMRVPSLLGPTGQPTLASGQF